MVPWCTSEEGALRRTAARVGPSQGMGLAGRWRAGCSNFSQIAATCREQVHLSFTTVPRSFRHDRGSPPQWPKGSESGPRPATQHHLGAAWKCKLSAPTSDPLIQKHWGWALHFVLTSPPEAIGQNWHPSQGPCAAAWVDYMQSPYILLGGEEGVDNNHFFFFKLHLQLM